MMKMMKTMMMMKMMHQVGDDGQKHSRTIPQEIVVSTFPVKNLWSKNKKKNVPKREVDREIGGKS